MLYKNMKAMVHSLDGDTDFFDIVNGVLQRDTLAPHLFILHTSNINRYNKRKLFHNKKNKKNDKKQIVSRRNNYIQN